MTLAWWQSGIVYQVYPRSFADSDGDGTGDLRGIAGRLDHLTALGVDALWVSPVYPSPMTDFGYDVADYTGIDPLFGDMADMDALIAAAHVRGLKLILDFVPNHTSDQHAWFVASRAGGDKRDWYLWRDPAPGAGPPSDRPPNNWQSNFGGSGWTFDDATGQFYYHSFLPTQPDLNWRNLAVRAAMFDALRFWLRRGVDGFRIDVMWMMIKDDQFRDNPPNPHANPNGGSHDTLIPLYTADRPEVHEVVAQMRAVLDEFPARVLIGEIYLPIPRLVTYYGQDLRGAQLPFNFQLLTLPQWDAATLAGVIAQYNAALPAGGWPNWVLGNHDRPRIASRVGPAQARVAAMLLLTLRGTPTIYMGEELGMQDTPIPADRVRDPAELREPGRGLGRDPERTPFPWQPGPGAGFTTGKPWLPIGDTPPLSAQLDDPGSMATLYQRLIAMRRAYPALVEGRIEAVGATAGVLRFRRVADSQVVTVALNITDAPAQVVLPPGRLLASTDPARVGLSGPVTLQPNEGVVVLG